MTAKKLKERRRKKNRQRRKHRQCGSKRWYASLEEAEEAVETMRIRHWPEDKLEWHAYKCEHCGRYHVGHVPKWLKEQENEEIDVEPDN